MKNFFCAAFVFVLFANGFAFAYKPLPGHINFCVPSPDGKRLATTQLREPVRIWDVGSGKELQRLGPKDSYFDVRFIAFFPDGKKIVIAGDSVDIWDIESGKVLQTLKGDAGNSLQFSGSMIFSSNGKKIVGIRHGSVASMCIWDAESGEVLQKLDESDRFVHSGSLSPDGKKTVESVYVGLDQTATVWDVESKEKLLVLTGHTERVGTTAFSPDGKKIVTGCRDDTARIWDAESGKTLHVLGSETEGVYGVVNVLFSLDGKKVATVSYGSTIRIWDTESGKELCKFETCKHDGGPGCAVRVVFLPDGKRMITACRSDIHIWDVESGKELQKVVLQDLYRKVD